MPALPLRGMLAVIAVLAAGPGATGAGLADPYRQDREAMVRTIEREAASVAVGGARRAIAAPVLEAMRRVPRDALVPADQRAHAYEDRPLPIGYGQTISQPYIVALMSDLLQPGRDAVVLEVGTGSGYQAAVLAELVRQVYTIEIVPQLAARAAESLAALGYGNVSVRQGDGYYGWPEHAPFDGIVVTAAATHVPPPLVQQLRPGGRMVIPVGPAFMVQRLMLVEKAADGTVRTELLLPVSFVPLAHGP